MRIYGYKTNGTSKSPPNYSDPTFYLGMNAIPKVSSYVYLDIPSSDDLLLKIHYISHAF